MGGVEHDLRKEDLVEIERPPQQQSQFTGRIGFNSCGSGGLTPVNCTCELAVFHDRGSCH